VSSVTGTLPIANGGTGQTTAAAAIAALLPSQAGNAGEFLTTNGTTLSWAPAASAGVASFSAGTTGFAPVSATTGAVTLSGTLNIANGGTGQTSAVAALNALLPAQAGNAGEVLTTDGTNVSWQPAAGGGGGGTVTSITLAGNDGVLISGGSPTGTISSSGTLTIDLGNIEPTSVNTSGTIVTTNNTSATNKTTGALRVTGGVGIQGDLYTRNLNADGNNVSLGNNATTTITVNNNRIRNVASPVVATDAVNLAALEAALQGTNESLVESGNFTPVLRFGTTPHAGTYTRVSGVWTRIGEMVQVSAFFQINSFVPGSGNANIFNLPFFSNGAVPGHVSYNSSTTVLDTSLQALITIDEIQIRRWTANGDAAFIDSSYFTNGTILQAVVWYRRFVPGPTVVDFSATPVGGVEPQAVSFTNLSTGTNVGYLWSFGDGNTSTATNPVNVYNAALGSYDVTLTAYPLVGPPVGLTKNNYINTVPGPGPIP
jgi:hypothetical protein